MSTQLRYFEDLQPYDLIPHEITHTLTKDEILEMAKKYDPVPYHLEEELAKQWGHPTISAPGVLTEAVCIKLLHANIVPIAGIGLAGKELTLPLPFYNGDTVTLWSSIIDKRLSRTKPDRGIVRLQFVLKNQNDKAVYDAIHTILVLTRPK